MTLVEPSERPQFGAHVHINYWVDRGGFALDLTQSAVEDGEDRGLAAVGELIERDGRAVRVHDIGGQRQLEMELEGTHVLIFSQTMPTQLLVDLALSLEPAQTEPPALT